MKNKKKARKVLLLALLVDEFKTSELDPDFMNEINGFFEDSLTK